ncbi:Glutaredoxin domain-containing cysteine-rich protein 1 [Homalodisca vitripennis]|nr:Glutaredoxin domain-containing cysteine-rich protein 1 [Homalodisca vitripennis]
MINRMWKTWQEREAGKVVVYTTTMGIVRSTYQRCLKVRQILRTHLVKFDERDVFMSRETQAEIKERMNSDQILVPQVFIEGQYIGDAEVIERLNETGELRRILKPYKMRLPAAADNGYMTSQGGGGVGGGGHSANEHYMNNTGTMQLYL